MAHPSAVFPSSIGHDTHALPQHVDELWQAHERRVDQCDAETTIVLHEPVDTTLVKYQWDSRRGRNLHVAWPANTPEQETWKNQVTTLVSARTPWSTRDSIQIDSILKDGKGSQAVSAMDGKTHPQNSKPKLFVKSLKTTPDYRTAQAVEATARWPDLLKRGKTHNRLNKYGPGVAPPGTKLTGAPDWERRVNEDEDETKSNQRDARIPKKNSIRVTHVASRDGLILAKHQRVQRGASFHAASKKDARVARTIIKNTEAGMPSKNGQLPGVEWRCSHFTVLADKKSGGASESTLVGTVESNDSSHLPTHPTYGMRIDTEHGYGSASQQVSRSKFDACADNPSRLSTRRTFRSTLPSIETPSTKNVSAVTLLGVAKHVRGQSTAAISSTYLHTNTLMGPLRKPPQKPRIGKGGGGLPVDTQKLAALEAKTKTKRETFEKTSSQPSGAAHVAAHITRLGALSKTFNDRQWAMVGKGVAAANIRIKDERSWVKG